MAGRPSPYDQAYQYQMAQADANRARAQYNNALSTGDDQKKQQAAGTLQQAQQQAKALSPAEQARMAQMDAAKNAPNSTQAKVDNINPGNKDGNVQGNMPVDPRNPEGKPGDAPAGNTQQTTATQSKEATGGLQTPQPVQQTAKDRVRQVSKDTVHDAAHGINTKSFQDATGRMVRGQIQGNHNDVNAATSQAQAQNYRNEAATHQMEAQRSQQIANQNPYAESGKIASVQNDAENRQRVQTAGVIGAGAALARKTNTPDVQSQMQREDQQQQVANERRDIEEVAQGEATAQEGDTQHYKIASRDEGEYSDKSSQLSMGEGEGETEEQGSETPAEQPAETEEAPTEPAPQPEQPAEEEKPTPESFNANWQNVMNYLTYGNDPTSKWSQPGGKDGGAAQKYAEAMKWQPLTQDDVANASNGFDSPTGELQQIMKNQRPEFMQAWEEGSGRVGEGGKQINKGDEGYEQAAQTNTQDVQSDYRMKDLKQCLCDMRMKWIKEDFDKYGYPSAEDLAWVANRQRQEGLFNHNGVDYDALDYDSWDDPDGTVLGAYADNIRNYVYNYKPEAAEIDPRIDPNQEHIGPMAQDIEQVNPACVNETPEGVKTVDTARLAMMNAGAIGDLAREMQEIKARLAKLGV